MKYFHSFLLSASLFLTALGSSAQSPYEDYKIIDDYVKSLGPLDTLNMGTICFVVTNKFPEPKDKARAIYDWITHNIAFDLKAGRSYDNEKPDAEKVLKSRKANAAGYAALFQDMCSVVKIRCLTVDGYVKNSPEQINEKPDGLNHTWVVVQLGQSPDTWYYVDPTWGSGFTDENMKTFTSQFDGSYFFADKRIFNYQHFPNNESWLLGPGSKNISTFLSLPLVKSAAYDIRMSKFYPADGLLKAKLGKPVSFTVGLNTRQDIESVSMVVGEGKRKKLHKINFTISRGNLNFRHEFTDEDLYPVTILINNKPLLSYMVDVTE